MTSEKLLKGNLEFRDTIVKNNKDNFKELADGQCPSILFIGCSDSRVVPDLMTNSNPGDLFIVRNVGNFVAPYKSDDDYHSTASAIEYAVSVLKVSEIIICGHTHCGACASLYDEINTPELIHTKKWLKLGESAKEEALKLYTLDQKDELLRATEKLSVISQVSNLLTYPAVLRLLKEDKLSIHGWIYDIANGKIEYYDRDKQTFVKNRRVWDENDPEYDKDLI